MSPYYNQEVQLTQCFFKCENRGQARLNIFLEISHSIQFLHKVDNSLPTFPMSQPISITVLLFINLTCLSILDIESFKEYRSSVSLILPITCSFAEY